MSGLEQNRRTEIEERIKNILISALEVDPEALSKSNSSTPLLGRGIGLDSIEALALAAEVETVFDIQVDDADLTVDLFKNIGTLAQYVLGKISERK